MSLRSEASRCGTICLFLTPLSVSSIFTALSVVLLALSPGLLGGSFLTWRNELRLVGLHNYVARVPGGLVNI